MPRRGTPSRVRPDLSSGRTHDPVTGIPASLYPSGAVGEFPEDVEVAVVPGGLLGQVEQDPAERDWLGAPVQGTLGGGVQVERRHQVAVPGAGGPVLGQQLSERDLNRDTELAVGIVVGPRRVDGAAGP